MGELIVDAAQLTFPWRERTQICPKCKGKGGEPWLVNLKRRPDIKQPPRSLLGCKKCGGTGELTVPEVA